MGITIYYFNLLFFTLPGILASDLKYAEFSSVFRNRLHDFFVTKEIQVPQCLEMQQ